MEAACLTQRPGPLLGSLAILGSPPFGVFLSEFMIVRASFSGQTGWLGFILLPLLVVAFIAFARTTMAMVFGSRQTDERSWREPGRGCWRVLAVRRWAARQPWPAAPS